MKKLILIIFCFFILKSVTFSQVITNNYISQYKDLAIQLMNENHIPASVILGVAIHESGSGTSKIAKYLNNHFGIKGTNNSTIIHSAYQGFETPELSYQAFIAMMKSRPQFNILFDQYSDSDYIHWAHGIQKGGYAASRLWASQVIGLIKKYKLYEYDNQPLNVEELVVAEDVPHQDLIKHSVFYKVKSGDNLNQIADKFDTTAARLMKKNHLQSSILQIGQKLRIK